MPEQSFEDKWGKFQKTLRDLGVKVSLTFHQICTLISPRAFWKSTELQDLLITVLFLVLLKERDCSRLVLVEEFVPQKKQGETWGFPHSSPFLCIRYEISNACSNYFRQSGTSQTVGIYISRSTWFILTEKGRARPYQQLYCWIWDSSFQLGGSDLIWMAHRRSPLHLVLVLEKSLTLCSLEVQLDGEGLRICLVHLGICLLIQEE